MAAQIADVQIQLRAGTAALERDLGKGRGAIDRFARDTESRWSRLGSGLARALPIAAVTSAIVASTKATLDWADELQATATRLDVGTEALQSFRFAAGDADVDVGQLERSLAVLSRRAGEAAAIAEGATAKAFRRLGVEIRDAGGNVKSTEQLFREVGAAIDALPSHAERAAAAQELLGDRTGALVPLFRDQGRAMQEAEARARELSVVSADLVAEGAALHRSFEVLGEGLGGRFRAQVLDAVSALNALGESMLGIPREGRGPRNLAKQLLDAETREARLAELELEAARTGRARLPPGGAPDLGLPSGSLGTREEIRRAREAARAETERLRDLLARATGAPSGRPVFSPTAGVDSEKAAAAAKREALDAERMLQRLREDRLQAEGRTIELLQERFRLEQRAIEAAPLSEEQRRQALEDLGRTFDAQTRAAVDAADKTGQAAKTAGEEIKDEFNDVGKRLSSVFATMLLEGEFTFKSLGQAVLREFVDAGVRVAGRELEKLFEQLIGSFGDAAAGEAASGLLGAIGGALGLAEGGIVTRPTFAMVGESGPEAVIPLDRLSGSGGGLTVNVINNASDQVGVEVRQNRSTKRTEIVIDRRIAQGVRSAQGEEALQTYGVQRQGRRRV